MFLGRFVEENIKYIDFACFYENTYEFWNLYRKPHQIFFLRLPFSVIGQFSLVTTSHWTEEKSS